MQHSSAVSTSSYQGNNNHKVIHQLNLLEIISCLQDYLISNVWIFLFDRRQISLIGHFLTVLTGNQEGMILLTYTNFYMIEL